MFLMLIIKCSANPKLHGGSPVQSKVRSKFISLVLVACGLQIFSTNNTECGRLLEEIKCARCSPNAQVLFHSLDMDRMPHREPDLPRLCQDFCREFYYTCRGHIPGNYKDSLGCLIANDISDQQ